MVTNNITYNIQYSNEGSRLDTCVLLMLYLIVICKNRGHIYKSVGVKGLATLLLETYSKLNELLIILTYLLIATIKYVLLRPFKDLHFTLKLTEMKETEEHTYQVSFMLDNTAEMWWLNVARNVLLFSIKYSNGDKIEETEIKKNVFYSGLCDGLKGKIGTNLNPNACYTAYIKSYGDQYEIIDCIVEN